MATRFVPRIVPFIETGSPPAARCLETTMASRGKTSHSTPVTGDTDDTPAGATVSALERGIAVLRCFREDVRDLSNAELARMTGIPKPTVTRLATTLVVQGLMKQAPGTERFSLSAGVVSLAQAFLGGIDLRAFARPHMAELADQANGAVYLGVRDGLDMVLVETASPRAALLLARLRVGSRFPMVSSALGRAYVSAVSDIRERERLELRLRESAGADEWQRLEAGYARAQDDAGRHGYCLSLGEFHRDIHSVAVPLVVPGGEIVALNCGGPSFLFSEGHLRQDVAPMLLATARAIAREVGGFVPAPGHASNVA
jgi:DNA-binding IclR family transcriptional regulator